MSTKIDVVVAYGPIKVIISNKNMDAEQKIEMIEQMVDKALNEAEKN